jgi:cell division protein FtsB
MPGLQSRNSPQTRERGKTNREIATPQWLVFTVIVSMTIMLCLTINLRAFSEVNVEAGQNQKLSVEVDQLTNENLSLQEEIHILKTNSSAIEREARKFGMSRINEKIFVSAN